ncbi:hypothetical protein [Capybara microvirus Cap1_SP_223]|nr:hypothetical protein [Capybara microvirus Cap1_SP_223]
MASIFRTGPIVGQTFRRFYPKYGLGKDGYLVELPEVIDNQQIIDDAYDDSLNVLLDKYIYEPVLEDQNDYSDDYIDYRRDANALESFLKADELAAELRVAYGMPRASISDLRKEMDKRFSKYESKEVTFDEKAQNETVEVGKQEVV